MDPNSVNRTVLPNGLTVLVQEDHSSPVVAIVTYVKAGYFDETDDENGLAHALEHMFFKGTKTRGVGDIAKETKASGGYLNAHTIYDNTTYYTVLPSSGFEKGLEIQADAYANSVIAAEELAKEMEVIIQEAKRKSDNPSAVATETLYEMLHDVHRMRRWRIGREPGLRAFTRAKMKAFYRNFYRPSNTILVISGDVDPVAALGRVQELYGDLTAQKPMLHPGPAEPEHPGFRYRELTGDIAQTQLLFGWRTEGTLDAETPILDVTAAILASGRASRLYRAVREKKLASSITAYDYTPTELGVFVIHAETEPEKTREAAAAIWEQVRQIAENAVEETELTRARRVFETRWLRRLETAEGRANYLAEWEALGDWRLGDVYFHRYVSATGDDVKRAAQKCLSPERAAALVYRPENSAVVARSADEMLAVLSVDSHAPRPVPSAPNPVRARANGSATFDGEEAGVSVFCGSHGMPILVRRKTGAAIAHIGVSIVGGAVEEPGGSAGLTLLTARTMLKGTVNRTASQIAEDSELLGGSISATAASDGFGWSFSVLQARMGQALELLGDVIQNPTIPDDALETERAVALSNVAMLRDDMYRYPMRLAGALAFAGHPYGNSPMGTEDSLRSISSDQVREWHRTRVLESQVVVGVVADIEPQKAADLVARELEKLELKKLREIAAPAWPRKSEIAVESRDKAQTAMVLAFPAPSRTEPTRFAASLIGTVASGLGGRFFDELRDRQSLAYTVHAGPSEKRLAGIFASYIATSPDKEEVARRGLLAEFAKLRDKPVADDELSRAKEYTIGAHAIAQESAGSMLAEMLDAWMFGSGLHEIVDYVRRVRAVTADEIVEVARRYFDPERRVEGVVRGVGRTV
ncbi:MAG: M16 family metallopeptidase [Gemmatimonadaceae bacterium]